MIGIDGELEMFFKTYVETIRPQFGNKSKNLHVTTEGLPFKKGTICRRMPELWERSGVRPDLRNFSYALPVYGASDSDLFVKQNFLDRCMKRKFMSKNVNIRDLLEKADKTLYKKRSNDPECPFFQFLPKEKNARYNLRNTSAKSFYLRSDKTCVAAHSADIIALYTIRKAAAASTNERLHYQSEKEKVSTCTSPKAPAIESMVEDVETLQSPNCSSPKVPAIESRVENVEMPESPICCSLKGPSTESIIEVVEMLESSKINVFKSSESSLR